jgi:hypothetical protein
MIYLIADDYIQMYWCMYTDTSPFYHVGIFGTTVYKIILIVIYYFITDVFNSIYGITCVVLLYSLTGH